MSAVDHTPVAVERAPDFVPAEWTLPPERDVALDLLRGLAMLVLVVNHLRLDSPLSDATSSLFSAAEVLVAVSGVVAGMVFGRRWRAHGRRATTFMLLRRARKLYVASVAVVAVVAALRLVPGLATDALTVSASSGRNLYAASGTGDMLASILVLEAGPWQFSILGFFVAALVTTPLLLWTLDRGWWPHLLALSWATFAAARMWHGALLPSQSEHVFPVMIWQLLFTHGVVAGFHRRALAEFIRRRRATVKYGGLVLLGGLVVARLGAPLALGEDQWSGWRLEHFDKATLDPARVAVLTAVGVLAYLALSRRPALLDRAAAAVLLPLGRNSFYVFIVHVFICLAVASLAGEAARAPVTGVAVEVSAVALLVLMVRRRFLFRWIPR